MKLRFPRLRAKAFGVVLFKFCQASLGAVGRDGGLADKAGGFVDGETRSFDVSLEIGTGFQGAALARVDIALDRSLNGDEACFDVANHFTLGANG